MKVNVPITEEAVQVFREHLDEVLTLEKCKELEEVPFKKLNFFEDQVEFLFPDEMDKSDFKILYQEFISKFDLELTLEELEKEVREELNMEVN